MSKLRPCPLCYPKRTEVELFENDYGTWQIGCGACGTTTGIYQREAIDKLIAHWNTRNLQIPPGWKIELVSIGGVPTYRITAPGDRKSVV